MREMVVGVVRRKGQARRSRNLEERLMVRFPSIYRALAAATLPRLSPRSRLRRALVRRALVSGWDAFSRRDFELMLVRYPSDVEFEFPPGQQTFGFGGTFRGREAMGKGLSELSDGWASTDLEPVYLIDLGDRLVFLGYFRVRGEVSGVRLEQEFAQLVTLRNGLPARDQGWFRWDEALGAAGLDPDAFDLR